MSEKHNTKWYCLRLAPGADITSSNQSESVTNELSVDVTHNNEHYICERPQHTKPFDEQCLTPHILGKH